MACCRAWRSMRPTTGSVKRRFDDFRSLQQLQAEQNWGNLITQFVRKRHEETISLFVQLARFVLRYEPLLFGCPRIICDRGIHAAIYDIDHKVAASLHLFRTFIFNDFIGHIGKNPSKYLHLA